MGFVRKAALWVAAASLLWMGVARAAAPSLVLVAPTELTSTFHGTWLTLIYEEALRQLGYTLVVRTYPAARATMMSDSGQVDGELNRSVYYGGRHPGMVRVEPAHFSIAVAAYAHTPLKLADGWKGLMDLPYRVDYRSGVETVGIALARVVPAERLSSVPVTVQGLRKLMVGHTDLYVDLENAVDGYLDDPEFARAGLWRVAVEEVLPMHVYLHQRHAPLARRLSTVLARLQRDGFVEACRREALRRDALGAR